VVRQALGQGSPTAGTRRQRVDAIDEHQCSVQRGLTESPDDDGRCLVVGVR